MCPLLLFLPPEKKPSVHKLQFCTFLATPFKTPKMRRIVCHAGPFFIFLKRPPTPIIAAGATGIAFPRIYHGKKRRLAELP